MRNGESYSESVRRLMQMFGRLPGVGARSAERMAFHILKNKREEALALADAIRDVKENVHNCRLCFNFTEGEVCAICLNPARDHTTVCVVENPKDLMQLEATAAYRGVYHVLLGHISGVEGVGPDSLTVPQLMERIKASHAAEADPAGAIREVILATNPTMDGDGTSLYVQSEVAALGVNVTRLARGLPAGSQIEYSNKAILADAINGRVRM